MTRRLAAVLLALAAPGAPGEERPGPERLAGRAMGASYEVLLDPVPAGADRRRLADDVAALLRRLDREVFSVWTPDSELSRLNRHPVGEPFAASAELIEVLTAARAVSESTAGAFDATAGALVRLWGFGPGGRGVDAPPPTPAEIEAALARTGFRHVAVDGARGDVRRLRDVSIDLGGIAKGYAADRVAALLDRLGASAYLVEVGGEIRMKGRKGDGRAWRVALEAPDGAPPRMRAVLSSRGEALAAAGSGDYRNYYLRDGERISHELDPRAGRPIGHGLAAVHVLAGSAMLADALATAYMVLGPREGRALAEREGRAARFIVRDGSADGGFAVHDTAPMREYLAAGARRGDAAQPG